MNKKTDEEKGESAHGDFLGQPDYEGKDEGMMPKTHGCSQDFLFVDETFKYIYMVDGSKEEVRALHGIGD